MGHYVANLRDIEFNLFEVFDRSTVLGTPPHSDLDVATTHSILHEVERLATTELASSLLDSDRHPPRFESGSVTTPESFRRSYQAYMDAEWWRLDLPEALGGTPAPPSLRWAVAEMILGANPAVHMYASGPKFAHVLHLLGSPMQKALARHMVERGWGATMVLTEPDAGSDVGAGRTKAIPQDDGSWHIEGVKRFISGGEHDLAENIVHFVLARPVGAGPGTKGLSLFVVPKWLFDSESGEPTTRNGVIATNLEHKMGLKASATCELTFGENSPAVGWLVGDVHDGIRQMFRIIEYARMLVGTKAIATLSTGYLNALAYARERVQGADLLQQQDKTAPRVSIMRHPDVRQMLMLQKAYVEGLRALVLYTATLQDRVEVAASRGESDEDAEALNDLLLPVVKGVGSERSYEMLALSLQVLGGSGYLQDYPIEQYIRDAKIDSVYEGTTGIQGLDLFFRKIVRDRGRALSLLLGEVIGWAKSDSGNGALRVERELLAQAVADVQGIVVAMSDQVVAAMREPRLLYKAGLNTTRLLMALGELIIGWLLLRQADVALAALASASGDRAFYEGKVAAARFFAATRLPLLAGERAVAESTSLDLMDLDDAAF
jgi:alkylation response protein AidB-like acyl-CoA dehydrogenase